MVWFVLIGLLILTIVLRTWAALGMAVNRSEDEGERYLEELIRNSEHSEN